VHLSFFFVKPVCDAGLLTMVSVLQAVARFEDAIHTHPDPPDYFYRNAGIAYGRLRMREGHCRMVSLYPSHHLSASFSTSGHRLVRKCGLGFRVWREHRADTAGGGRYKIARRAPKEHCK